MKKQSSLSAVVALAAAGLPFGGAAAASIEITGSTYWGFPGYGTSQNKNNVVNGPNSGLRTSGWGNPWKAGGSVLSSAEYYEVDWYFNGAESGNTNQFTSMSLVFSEANQNNSFHKKNDPGWEFIGTTTGSGAGAPIPLQVTDTDFATGGTVVNGANQAPGPSIASLIFSYANPKFNRRTGELIGWYLTTKATDWFVFAFDDPGSDNDDHDDFVGIGHLRVVEAPSPVPLPGALPLMGTVIGGSFLLRRWRGHRRARANAKSAALI